MMAQSFPPIPGDRGFISHTDDAPAYRMQGILWSMLADRDATGGRWSMMEQLMPMGAGPPPHRHLWSDETFYLLNGTITFLIGDEVSTAGAGAFIGIPRGTRHAFQVDSDTARILNRYTPAGMEAMVAELAERTDSRALPPPAAPRAPGRPRMSEDLLARYGLQWLDEPDPLAPRAYRKGTGHD